MIEVKGISKNIGPKKILRNVSFTVKKGEITCLIGMNGAGKSTALKAMTGLMPINRGDILVDGASIKRKRSKNVSYIPDHLTMLTGMRISEAFRFMADFYPQWDQEKAEEMVSFFGLDKKEKLGSLSKGNGAKLSLAIGLALQTDYVLLDEPFSGIDVFSKEKIRELFSSPFIEERGILITTHEIEEIEHLLDRVLILKDGVITKDFYTEEIRAEEGKSVIDMLREVYEG